MRSHLFQKRKSAVILASILAWNTSSSAVVSLEGDHEIVPDPLESEDGNLEIYGFLDVHGEILWGKNSSETGPGAETYVAHSSGAILSTDLTDSSGTFRWMDSTATSPRTKMTLTSGNSLKLYKSDGSMVGIELDPATSSILLPSSGSMSLGGSSFISTSGGRLLMGGSDLPVTINNSTISTSSSTGALVVNGGLGVASDSFINGLRVGRGGGNVNLNTALGSQALNSNTSGFNNTAMGFQALDKSTTGFCNTAVGTVSMLNNITGSNNSAYGYHSLSSNTTGSQNASFGTEAMLSNTTGYGNLAIGSYALRANTTSDANVAIGLGAMYAHTSGGNNVAIGSSSGRYLSSGSDQTGASNSIFIGNNTRSLVNHQNNSITIGNDAVSLGSHTTVIGNSNTTTTRLYGQVQTSAISSTNPSTLALTLKGKVVLENAQGDISMGIYE